MNIYNLLFTIITKIKLTKFYIILFLFLLVHKCWAPARMHTNTIIYPTGHKYETKEKYEVCRLKKEVRRPTEIKCFYTRQDKYGSELIITNDQPTFSCLKQMKCKKE